MAASVRVTAHKGTIKSKSSRDDEDKVMKEGYLLKESSFWKKNRQRWIVLTKGQLFAFKHKLDFAKWRSLTAKSKTADLTEVFDLNEFNRVHAVKNNESKLEYQFEIVSNQTSRKFAAASYYELEDWMAKIRNVQQWAKTNFDRESKASVHDPEYFEKL
mmetsp:Transcript_70330/g.111830  ORF Transcript_70330/g.111830 Transcript_70330/m.111830 type:complete len:159 (-) Transcript_70330:287-763(-)|eukprot:CAMPEP_0197032004 /NCGR_PEP_ID=MMETSP1384-20130603/10794_1 /TAXON_ID=29189 /ORGANISM="Ammonia sp." /LENGTH=158 /DNA_ID=CAMNT_0042461597 /DNA_START=19 /DNA_END=495 /DNA_ORIENTATION=-